MKAWLSEAQCNLLATAVRGRRLRVVGFTIFGVFFSVSWLGGPETNPATNPDMETYR